MASVYDKMLPNMGSASTKFSSALAALDRADEDVRAQTLNNMRRAALTGNMVVVGDTWLDPGEAGRLAASYTGSGAAQPKAVEYVSTEMYNPEEQAYRGYMAEAMRNPEQMSRWAKAQRGMATSDRARMGGQAQAQAAQQSLAAQRGMAARGGLSGGALERAAQARTSTFAGLMNQGNEQFNRDMLNVGAQDEDRRISMLQTGSGMEMDRARYIQQARENENLRRNAFNANQYNQQMAAWGARKTADAQKKAAEDAAKK